MEIKINDQIIDPNKEPVAIIFKDDAERKFIASLLTDMEDKEGERWLAFFPSLFPKEDREKFMQK